MMLEWYSMFACTWRPARLQALAKTSAAALMPLPCGPPIIQERWFFKVLRQLKPRDSITRNYYGSRK